MTRATLAQTKTGQRASIGIRNVLLICGILSSLLYVYTDIAAALRWEGYSYTSQAVSELEAIGAPTRPFLVSLFSVCGVLSVAFGVGVLASAGRKWSLRVTGILLIVFDIVGELTLLFFPMHLRGGTGSLSDTMHIVLSSVLALSTLLFVGFGAAAFGKRFRLYSMGTIVILLIFGALAGMNGPRLAANLPTPWLGVMERVNIYSSMLWMAVLAVTVLRASRSRD